MANEYFTPTGYPATGAAGSSASMRSELALVEDGFDKLPALTGNGGKIVAVNSAGNALATSATLSESGGTLTVAGNLSVTGDTTLGNASGDALTIASSAVTWSGNPTHSGNHTFSGGLTLSARNANQVVYLDGSKAAATSSGFEFDGAYLTATFKDTTFTLKDDADATKVATFELSGITSGQTRAYTLPNVSGALATLGNVSQTFTGAMSFSASTFSVASASATFSSSTSNSTVSIAAGANTSGTTKAVNIGTSGLSGSTTNVTIGSSVSGATSNVTVNGAVSLEGGTFTFNDSGADLDARFEGDTDANLLFLDASTDRVGVGTNSPNAPLQLNKNGVQLGVTTAYLTTRFHETSADVKGVSLGYDSGSQTGIVLGNTATASSNLAFWTFQSGGTGWAERMRITAAGDVGIGTASPGARLQVKSTAADAVRIEGTTARGSGNIYASFYDPTGRKGYLGYSTAIDDSFTIVNELNAPLRFFTNNTERMHITSPGDVGIGTTSPASKLHVVGTQAIVQGTSSSLSIWKDGTPSKAARMAFNTSLSDGLELGLYDGSSWSAPFVITSAGNVIVGSAALATNATNGFFYIPGCAGTPTGTPTSYTGRVPLVVDTTNNKLYFYSGGQWRDAGP